MNQTFWGSFSNRFESNNARKLLFWNYLIKQIFDFSLPSMFVSPFFTLWSSLTYLKWQSCFFFWSYWRVLSDCKIFDLSQNIGHFVALLAFQAKAFPVSRQDKNSLVSPSRTLTLMVDSCFLHPRTAINNIKVRIVTKDLRVVFQ